MVTSWTKIEMPWVENENFSEVLLDKVNFIDILDHWKIEYSECSSGDFTHRMKCPLPLHADGNERTPSCYFSKDKNKFFCFGCNSGSNIIDFVILYTGKPYHEAVRWLSNFAGITNENLDKTEKPKKPKKDPEKTILKNVFRTGILIRDFLIKIKNKNEYSKWKRWADKKFVELDEFTEKLEDRDWEKAKEHYEKVNNFIKSKS